MQKHIARLVAGMLVVVGCAGAAVSPPDGRSWWLGPELITNGTFETDTPGSTPAGWQGVSGTAVTTNASAHTGNQSMELTVMARTTYSIPTQPGRYYRLEVYWQQLDENWGPNLRIGLLDNPGTAGDWPRGVEVVGGQPYAAAYYVDDWPAAATEMTNGVQPMWRDYTYVLTWQHWEATLEILPSITDFGSLLRHYWYGTGGSGWRVDDISLREWLVPEPAGGLLVSLGGCTLALRRRARRTAR
ncbi:MAG: hypothetical protein BWZ02_00074 [Lentisphaerae bacterium ADurb.BinA184]|nr:MAG: hypothetical protein BWZ02_00074 [Lentisphaerae bacterium ADurb.BinA184]